MNKPKFYSLVILAGAFTGLFILCPIQKALYYLEFMRWMHGDAIGLLTFLKQEFAAMIRGEKLVIPSFYMVLGVILALISSRMYRSASRNKLFVQQVSDELGRTIHQLIADGEGPLLEFKSSLRWDCKLEKINKALEAVILKTLSGFMNSGGGTLLIGVADDQEVLGLQNDYNTLRKKDRDGFEIALMTLVSSSLGTDLCKHVHILFHEIDGKDICRVIISGSPRPVYLKHDGKLKLFVRAGGSTRELNLQEAVEYISNHWTKNK